MKNQAIKNYKSNKKRYFSKPTNNYGYLLIESLFTIAIVGIALLSVSYIQVKTLHQNTNIHLYERAGFLASEYFDTVLRGENLSHPFSKHQLFGSKSYYCLAESSVALTISGCSTRTYDIDNGQNLDFWQAELQKTFRGFNPEHRLECNQKPNSARYKCDLFIEWDGDGKNQSCQDETKKDRVCMRTSTII